MLAVNGFDGHVAARLLDFFGQATPWHRRLWNPGLVLTLRETLEASEAVRFAVLSKSSLQLLCNSTMKLAGVDPGAGSSKQKSLLQQCLQARFQHGGRLDHEIVQQVTRDISENYLARWARSLGDAKCRPHPERTARSIASHLLDAGFSSDYLHRWWTFRIYYESGYQSLADLAEEAHKLVKLPPREYELMIGFKQNLPQQQGGGPSSFADAPTVSRWLREKQFDVSGVRQKGGIIMKVEARDPRSAVEIAEEAFDKLSARVAVGTRGHLKTTETVWIAGQKDLFKFGSRSRSVEVHALQREGQVYSQAKPGIVDAAIELLAPLASSSPSVAVAGGWAAIEALLSEPGDRGVAADRMASLVACSFPRAELTLLSYKVENENKDIADTLKRCSCNRDRAHVLATAIQKAKSSVKLSSESDKAALHRMRHLLTNPYDVLLDIEGHVMSALRRLYRQRNIVLHWGRTDAVALRASLRTAAPLVGAGMDRIAHAWFVEGTRALELTARASIALRTAGSTNERSCVDLLAQ